MFAREARAKVLRNVDIVHELLSQQRQPANAFSQQAADLAAATHQQMEGVAAEQCTELIRLGNAHVGPKSTGWRRVPL